MSGRESTRRDDELLLWMIECRVAGYSSYQIGRELGRTSTSIRTATERVRKADGAESGEDVQHAYWSSL